MTLPLNEILVILLVALVVLKPEQLPQVANTCARLIKRIKQQFDSILRELRSHD